MLELDAHAALELLKSQPSAEDTSRSLAVISKDQQLSLEAAAVIVKYVIPAFPSLPQTVKRQLVLILGDSFVLVTHILSFTKLLQDKPEGRICRAFLIHALGENPAALANYVRHSKTKLEQQMLKSAFFGSRILNCLGSEIDIVGYLELVLKQMEYLLDHPSASNNKINADFLVALLSLHESHSLKVVFQDLALSSEGRFQNFILQLQNGSALSRNRLIKSLLIYLDYKVSPELNDAIYNILKQTGVEDIQYETLTELRSTTLKTIVVQLMSEEVLLKVYRYLIGFFRRGDDADDNLVCTLLAVVLEGLSSSVRFQLGSDSAFLDAVTKRLSSQDALVRERTMFLAKQITNGELTYESDFKIDIPIVRDPGNKYIDFGAFQNHASNNFVQSMTPATVESLVKLSISEDGSNEDGFDIVFLKDLVREFEQLAGSSKDRVQLLRATVKLVRQKRDFILEVESYSSQLLAMICSLNNDLDESEFQEWKLNAMVSIIVTVPGKIVDLVQILFGQELSLQQRITILSVMSLAARELRGLDDGVIVKPKTDFPTKRLPWDQPFQDVHAPISNTTANEAHTVWRSRKLEKLDSSNAAHENRFRKVAPKFFYPLAHGWLNGIDMGVYDAMFKKHYLSTMQIILSAAHPHHEFNSMYALMCTVLEDAVDKNIKFDDSETAKFAELSKLSKRPLNSEF
ncbi:LANO_0F09692g1_1 [Lachancea nothofagi CBS 11611]|uniref:LANO_0F09692g1_1 n=1 Tax=Lachancea nothofagi CBS 11611 TaxID=1266666 RepID=A0A1G4KA24_9SACH|nr:LANO_0F09692g1_1 [Lachancea nothofagi CBS 11611]